MQTQNGWSRYSFYKRKTNLDGRNKTNKEGHFAQICHSPVAAVRGIVVSELMILCDNDVRLMDVASGKIKCQMNKETPRSWN